MFACCEFIEVNANLYRLTNVLNAGIYNFR